MPSPKEIVVKTQKQLGAIKKDFDGFIYIEGGTEAEPLYLNINFEKATVIVRGRAYLSSVSGSAQIGSVSGSAQIGSVSGSAQIGYVYDSAQIGSVYDSAQIRYVSGSAQIRYVSGSAQIGSVSGSAQIDLFGEAVVSNANGAQKIICHGHNTVIVHKADKSKIGLVLNKNSHLVVLDMKKMREEPSFPLFAQLYPVDVKNGKAKLYKAVHKRGDAYASNHDPDFTYQIGETKTEAANPSTEESCTKGLHVSHLPWALRFGADWSDLAILECEVNVKDIIVAKDCDGKIRTSKLKVIREVPESEYWK